MIEGMTEGEQFWEWINFGIDQGWCSEITCDTHEGIPMTTEEAELRYEEDICLFMIRLWDKAGSL